MQQATLSEPIRPIPGGSVGSIVRLTGLDNAKSSRCGGEPLRCIVRGLTMGAVR